jgi:hypothetical protein
MAAERGHLGMVMFEHDCREEGASGRAISITDWNNGLGRCQQIDP